MNRIRVLVAGLGNMGRSHALAYHNHPNFEIAGLVNRSEPDLPPPLSGIPVTQDFYESLAKVNCDAVSINTYSNSHADYAIAALEAGKHVFLEKPMATTVDAAERVVEAARVHQRTLVVGYILRHHPSWVRLVQEARQLGGPYVFRLNLNQQSSAATWQTHKQLMQSTSPIVDCGVHYVDVMCQITDAIPVKVSGMGLRLTDDIPSQMYNYGHFQVYFDDGSIGWYEAGWGPMISETAYFVKDIISPRGAVSIVMDETARSDDIDTHTRTSCIRVHRSELNSSKAFKHEDVLLDMQDEPDHQELCNREQAFFSDAIVNNLNLERHWRDALLSLRVCLAADESVRSGNTVELK
ncbi:MAG: Gfo/Idh/MocA family oxidoreductase [Granulosicoccus sp.]|nr:Gfo/Idh/MocA family oxidoreductase [Granulosicoccus sp.]